MNHIENNLEWNNNEHLEIFNKIKEIYDNWSAFFSGFNEKQLETKLFMPVFQALGHIFEVNEKTERSEFPDYSFFPSNDALENAHKFKKTKSFFDGCISIGEVKKWDLPLDKFGLDRDNRKRNPSLQIWLYLEDVKPRWGILSNGKKWRLYTTNKKRDDYFEVDLEDIISNRDLGAFKFFYYLFRREAFLQSGQFDPLLERLLFESTTYAMSIGEDLKENVYKSMKTISDGFFIWKGNDLNIETSDVRKSVQDNTMLLLYRLLFLFYAEGKGLLDLNNKQYLEQYSLYKLRKEIAENQDGPEQNKFLPVGTHLWSRLQDIFRLIDKGSESFGIPRNQFYVPPYNGGLFNPEKNIILDGWKMGDSFLAEAVDLLSRSEGINGKMEYVDYSTLEIRHLGSIYEGLLEYSLEIAKKEMVAISDQWVGLEEYNKDKKRKKIFDDFKPFDRASIGQLYLATTKGERKATGSYYTPDVIVDFIVEYTIKPIVDDRLNKAIANKSSQTEAIQSIRVLDPSMGSGHFLVGTIEYLAGQLLEATHNDIQNGLLDYHDEYSVDWARRQIASRCIYGVDLNNLAVELAKVSVWLSTISKDKPLSFLDHRLKQGNSLIGATLSELKNYPTGKSVKKDQTTLPSFVSPIFITHLIGKIGELEKVNDDSVADIKKKEEIFDEFKRLPEYRKAKSISDIYTSFIFGNLIESSEKKTGEQYYYDLLWAIMGQENEWKAKTSKPWFSNAIEICTRNFFFHWELEFPEIFFNSNAPNQDPGWDAIVGNPPYIRIQELNKNSKENVKFYSYEYYSASGKFDIYVLFVEKSRMLINKKGRIGFIMPVKFTNADYGRNLRKIVHDERLLEQLIDLSDTDVFKNVTTYPGIFLMSRDENREKIIYRHIEGNLDKDSLPEPIDVKYSDLKLDKSWVFADRSVQDLLNDLRIKSNDVTLNKIVKRIFQGINSGVDDVFLLKPKKDVGNNGDTSVVYSDILLKEIELESELLHPILKGAEVTPYFIKSPEYLVLYPYEKETDQGDEGTPVICSSIMEKKYPLTWSYFNEEKISTALKAREYLMESIEGKGTSHSEWYEMWAQRRLNWMLSPKIVTRVMSKENGFALDSNGELFFVGGGTAGCNAVLFDSSIVSEYYLLAILNSRMANFYLRETSIKYRGGFFSTGGKGSLKDLPIIVITPEEGIEKLDDQIEDELQNAIDMMPDGNISSFEPNQFLNKLGQHDHASLIYRTLIIAVKNVIEVKKMIEEEKIGFLKWVSKEVGASMDNMKGKSFLENYEIYSFNTFLENLRKNKNTFKPEINLRKRNVLELIESEFNKSFDKLKILSIKINKERTIIDSLIYNLYDLKSEEVELINRKTNFTK